MSRSHIAHPTSVYFDAESIIEGKAAYYGKDKEKTQGTDSR